MPKLSDLKVKLFTDGADKAQILDMAKQPWIAGFTTNPSLLKKAGVRDYEAYAGDLVAAVRVLTIPLKSLPCPIGTFRSRCSPTIFRKW